MDGQFFGGFTVVLLQEFSKFDLPMPWITRTDDLPLQQIQRINNSGHSNALSKVFFGITKHE
jgi:hypothetical protein